ncbi:MAG TPA: alpha-amylase family glycosyl hydrolase [Ignavibacteriaceae bacterium]|nr:alpha-amylase family glycosyl hydrolase [Ignavibacteriaceae bacterium]
MYFNTLKVLIFIFFYSLAGFSQNFSVNKIEPPNWWVGMKWDTVQLMVYGENLTGVNVRSVDDKLKILSFQSSENGSYLFVDVYISNELEPRDYELVFFNDDIETEIFYPILSREISAIEHQGFSNEDVIYLIFADRFCDGNPDNNTIGDSLDQFTSDDLDGRKGGDIEGIISKLDYLKELGVTAVWITPMLENNMWMSYHGYAATDLYKIDPRFGSNELYKKLVSEAHKHGLKIILDHVSNHIGINHHWVNNPPASDWFNGTRENFIRASHDKMAFLDIHGDSITVKMNQQGWFTDYMPDLNQRNPFLKKYLIQNTLWWIEYAGIDGIREDTYPYNDQKYLADWAEAILTEYPNFNIVGEIWQGIPAVVSGYQSKSPIRKIDFDSNLPSVTDFALSDAIRDYLSGAKSIYKVYETIAQDIVYPDPDNLMVFFDNHDVDRAMLVADGDVDKYKLALNLVLFTRGISKIFYGTELGIKAGKKHGEVREPFPGGFFGDDRNAFNREGRTNFENDIYNYLQELLLLRKGYPVLAKGKLRHIYPAENVYILLKYYNEEIAMILINSSEEDISVESALIKKFLPEAEGLLNLKSQEEINLKSIDHFAMEKMTVEIFLIRK